uniref:Transposase n=2 Tax=Oryza sativa subsp. japonica TaxID=39947 RepID=Q10K17_ORYSJ|nr:putative transposase [Oryza sativa Japonica Group]AAK55483.1 hypothetical protein OSJNBa0015K03.10 [Oryza sativa Japonica Group]ABF96458.1 transposase, putative [Oryza sativa Japonica Group]
MWGDTRRRSTSSRPPERHCRRSPDPFRRSVDARQLSPGMDDYGVDDRHMDGLEGDGDDPMEQLIPKANDDTDLSTPGGEAEPFAPSAGRVERWRHFKKIRVIVDGIGHLNRYYLTHLKDKAPAGARQTQLSFGPDGSMYCKNSIYNLLQEFNLQSRVVSITLDNASANTTAMMILESNLQSYIGGYVIHQRCICHIINLIVQAGFTVISNLLNKIRQAVSIIGSQSVMKARFRDYCQAKDKPVRMFGIDVKHRWNTTYLMLRQLKGYEEIISVFINSLHVRCNDTDENGECEI